MNSKRFSLVSQSRSTPASRENRERRKNLSNRKYLPRLPDMKWRLLVSIALPKSHPEIILNLHKPSLLPKCKQTSQDYRIWNEIHKLRNYVDNWDLTFSLKTCNVDEYGKHWGEWCRRTLSDKRGVRGAKDRFFTCLHSKEDFHNLWLVWCSCNRFYGS